MRAILKKELKSYFLSPVGYVVIGIFLLCFSVFFYLTVFSQGSVDLGALYYYTALYGLIVIVPILTMRMFAEERKNGTEQLLMTSPISIFKIVIGKLFAAIVVILITLLLSLIFFAITSFFGKVNVASTVVAILGFVLISIAALAVGMFASSITENQIIAGIITIAFLLMSIYIPGLGEEFEMISIMDFYQKFPVGVISLTEVVSAVSIAGMFIAFTIIVMQRRKLVK